MSPNKSFAAKCQPTVQAVDGLTVHQYRGIKYGNITKRFAEPEIVSYGDSIDELECTQFGYEAIGIRTQNMLTLSHAVRYVLRCPRISTTSCEFRRM